MTFRLLRITFPDTVAIRQIDTDMLAADWQTSPASTRQIGDQWLDRAATPLLQVPSAIVPSGQNFLLNPAHPDAAKAAIVDVVNAPFDSRLLRIQ